MHAYIFVAPTPYALVVGEDGTFAFPAIEPGSYTLTVLSQGHELVRTVDLVGPRTEVGYYALALGAVAHQQAPGRVGLTRRLSGP
jgi:hypothetical protein